MWNCYGAGVSVTVKLAVLPQPKTTGAPLKFAAENRTGPAGQIGSSKPTSSSLNALWTPAMRALAVVAGNRARVVQRGV